MGGSGVYNMLSIKLYVKEGSSEQVGLGGVARILEAKRQLSKIIST